MGGEPPGRGISAARHASPPNMRAGVMLQTPTPAEYASRVSQRRARLPTPCRRRRQRNAITTRDSVSTATAAAMKPTFAWLMAAIVAASIDDHVMSASQCTGLVEQFDDTRVAPFTRRAQNCCGVGARISNHRQTYPLYCAPDCCTIPSG